MRRVAPAEVQRAEAAEVRAAKFGEFVEEGGQRLASAFAELRLAIEAIEGAAGAVLEDDLETRHPVGVLPVDQMADDVVGAPGVGAFVACGPGFGEIAKESVEGRGRAGEDGDGFI